MKLIIILYLVMVLIKLQWDFEWNSKIIYWFRSNR